MKKQLLVAALGLVLSSPVFAEEDGCNISADVVQKLQSKLSTVITQKNGGLFSPNRMWSAVVDRSGVLCSVIRSDPDAWPGSRSIAIAKASAANDFSSKQLALSTANLYSFTQPANSNSSSGIVFPAGSLYGLNNSNPFNPAFQPQNTGVGRVPGGIITFGGGVALYNRSGQVIGGLGVSGDTACADHAVAYKMRAAARLNSTPSSDNIVYLNVGELPHDLGHPHCYVGHDITP